MTPIERAARAMYDTISPDWDWDDPDADLLRRMYRANARAALAALRDASAAMIASGESHVASSDTVAVDKLWTVMVDAALVEKA